MKIITSDTEPNSQCSWAPDLGIRDDSRPQLGDLRQLAGKMQNSKPVIEYRRGSPNLQLSGQDHHSNQQVPFMCGIQCLWENLQVLLEMQNTLHPLHISLQQSYMDLAPSCSLFLRMFVGFFFTVAQIQYKVERSTLHHCHCLASWRIHRDKSWASDRPSLPGLFTSEGACLWSSALDNFYQFLW